MRPGDLLAGRFELEQVAGRGGMGTVWRARDRASSRPVAVKLVPFERPHDRERFAAEARALAELDHPHVVRYVWHGVLESTGVVVMEWLEGEDLASRLARGPLDPSEVGAVGLAVARALGEAHARGIVHRDVKPSNVFLPAGRADDARLLDFGLTEVRRAREGSAAGTARYMAPEQARGEPTTAAADLYSLGCVLQEALTGRCPADDRTEVAPWSLVRHGEPPRDATRALTDLIERLLREHPDERPASATEVAVALAGAAEVGHEAARHEVVLLAALRTELARERLTPHVVRELARGVFAVAQPTSTDARRAAREGERLARELLALEPEATTWLTLAHLGPQLSAGSKAQLAERLSRDGRPGQLVASRPLAALLGHEDATTDDGGGARTAEPDELVILRERLGDQRPRAPFVGRDAELSLARETLTQVCEEGLPRALVLAGAAGMGVSRLLAELRAAAPSELAWISLQAASFQGCGPMGAVAALARALPPNRSAPPELELAERWLTRCDEGSPPSLEPLGGLPHATAHLATALAARLAGLGGAVAVVIDDAHEVDRESAAALTATLELARGPLALVIAGRAGLELAFDRLLAHPDVQRMRLGALRMKAREQLGRALLGAAATDAAVRALATRSEGHPVFLEELARMPEPEGALPVSVQVMFEARFAALPERCRRVLSLVSLEPEGVDRDSLGEASGLEAATLGLAIDELVREAWLEGRAARLRFARALARDVVASMPTAHELGELRETLARALARRRGRAARLRAALQFRESARACAPAEAAPRWLAAAELFSSAGELEATENAALALFEVLELLAQAPPCRGRDGDEVLEVETRALELFGQARARTRRTSDALDPLSKVLGRVTRGGGLRRGTRARIAVATALAASGRLERADELLAEALVATEELDELRPAALEAALEVAARRGDPTRAVAAADELDARRARRSFHAWLSESFARALRGDHLGAARALGEARAAAPADDPGAAAGLAKHDSVLHMCARDFARAAPSAALAAELARQAGHAASEAACLHNLGDALHRLGRLDESRAALRASSEAARRAGHDALVRQNAIHETFLDGLEGSPDAAEKLAEHVLSLEREQRVGEAIDARILAARLAHARSPDRALSLARELFEAASRVEHGTGLADARELVASLGGSLEV